MIGEIIFTGTELLLGQILNTNAQYLQQALADLGIDLYYQVTVGDNLQRLAEAIEQASRRADLVIIGGGLGPTEDDLSREALARALDLPLIQDERALQVVRRFFDERLIPMPANNLKQALIPKGGLALDNPVGTAPGIILEQNRHTYILLPGPPPEFKFMIDRQAAPYLVKKLGKQKSTIRSRVLKLCGIGESAADEKLGELLHSANPTLAPTSRFGEVHLRITAKADEPALAERMNDETEARVWERLGRYIYGRDGETIAGAVGKLLLERSLTLATVETCTGGLLAHQLTGNSRAGEYLKTGFVLGSGGEGLSPAEGIPAKNLPPAANDGELAEQLASQVQTQAHADICVAITGQPQFDRQENSRPGSLVYIAISMNGNSRVKEFNLWGLAPEVRERAVQMALVLL
ncbi:MAG: competence/damage-inducible protein A, partial [Peptococcaceae bacterium]